MKKTLSFIFLLVGILWQNVFSQDQNSRIKVLEDSLIKISKAINQADDTKKIALNGSFVKHLVEALKQPKSFNYPFDSLKNVSVIPSPDKAFRILSWYVILDNGTYRYYGAIQMYTNNGQLKLYPLIDQTENLSDVNAVTNNQKWYGARYYEIIPIKSGNLLPYYILLGWKGNTPESTKKVIEVLTFKGDEVVFGASVFDGKNMDGKNRIIFEYAKSNAMYLKTDQNAQMIVFDHLAPINPEMEGKFEYYGSDGNFDGFKIIGGRLKLQSDVTLNNSPNANDELYADPKKKVKPIRKF